jgi:Uma2 family endonuclease
MAGMAGAIATSVPSRHWPAPAAGEWTVDMLAELPDDGRRYELLDGVLLVSPSPVPNHQLTVTNLLRLLDAALPPDHRALVAPLDWQPDDRTSLVPDLLVVSRADYRPRKSLEALTVVVEVASPSTARIDRTAKRDRYAQGGIAQYCIVDPGIGRDAVPSVTVYDLGADGYREAARAEGDQQVTVALPVPGAEPVTLSPQQLLEF